ncbi:MAG: hypothetical protein M1830_000636 [Pleopsidium flavum]|nr:MAG: hypothetical protein M1830_000636 [Pleopsidium flavum]
MATRTTRSSAVKEAALFASSETDPVPQQLSSPPATPNPTKKKATPTKKAANSKVTPRATPAVKKEAKMSVPSTPASTGKKRKRVNTVKLEEDINELSHNLGKAVAASEGAVKEEVNAGMQPSAKSSRVKSAAAKVPVKEAEAVVQAATATDTSPEESPTKKTRKVKANPYGLTPGKTPYPDWPHPTPEECQEVNDLLSTVHGKVHAPATIPAPSTTVSGCGEVPSILDALIRTLLSAATTGTNSSRAFKGLVEKFGILQEGIGKGSVDWDKVRRADVKAVFEAIKSGGLAVTKSKRIKEILNMVYEENTSRRDALVNVKQDENAEGPKGAENETEEQKDAEIIRAEEHVLSLDHLHTLSSDDALNTLIKYPGIGPKTASCVLLFCMQRPSFAVDTHVFRLCKWLNWVPPDKATRNTAYSHCEVRVPDGLKYPLHQLLIRHGKTCPRCRAATGEGGGDWNKGCPIEHLVKRSGKRKGGLARSQSKNQAGKKGKKGGSSEDGGEESEEPGMDVDDEEDQEGGESGDEDGEE